MVRVVEIQMFDETNSYVKESTIIHFTKAKDEEKWFVYDECGEGIQSDGDGELEMFESRLDALRYIKYITENYYKTYKNITGHAKVILKNGYNEDEDLDFTFLSVLLKEADDVLVDV